jgi:hypothetical protein
MAPGWGKTFTAEIVEDLQAALAQFSEIAEDFGEICRTLRNAFRLG